MLVVITVLSRCFSQWFCEVGQTGPSFSLEATQKFYVSSTWLLTPYFLKRLSHIIIILHSHFLPGQELINPIFVDLFLLVYRSHTLHCSDPLTSIVVPSPVFSTVSKEVIHDINAPSKQELPCRLPPPQQRKQIMTNRTLFPWRLLPNLFQLLQMKKMSHRQLVPPR